ncbi:MAG: Gfo/Idh/MocA family oxidoreductase, partial [Candidatus Limnocylindrales bacterium]
GGVLAEFTSGFVADHKGLDVFGSAGAIRTREPWDGIPGSFTLDDVEMPVEAANPYQLELEDVGAAIRGEKEPLLGRADAFGQARTIEALYRSAETGAPVTL